MLSGLVDHAIDLFLAQGATAGDGHRGFLAGSEILRGNVNNTVRIDVEGDFDLRNATRCGSDSGELEVTERLVVSGELTLALEDLDQNGGLAVGSGRVHARCLGRDCGVALDDLVHDATHGLDAQGQRSHVDQQNVLTVTLDDAGLQGCANCDDLIGVHALVGLAATGELLHELGNGGHTSGATDQDDVVDLADGDTGVLDDLLEGGLRALEQIRGHFLELCAGEGLVQVDGAISSDREVLQRDICAHRAGQFLLCLLGCCTQTLKCDRILREVSTALGLHLLDQPVNDALIPVIATQTVVACGCADLNGGEAVVILADFQQRDVEGTATEVEDQNELVFLALFEAVGQCRSGRLVDDTQDVQACDLSGILGCLTLCVVEVRRNGDDRVGNGLTEVLFRVPLELGEDSRGDLLCGVLLVVDVDGPVSAHVALDRRDGAINIRDRLTLGDLANQDLAGLGESNDRGGRTCTFCVCNDCGFSAFKYCDCGVRGAEVNTYCASHKFFLSSKRGGNCRRGDAALCTSSVVVAEVSTFRPP